MYWLIGDIHGMLRPLEALLAAIDRRDPAAHLIFLGDYVNRGPDTRKVVDLLIAIPHATFLRGNHDDIFDLVLRGDCYMCNPTAPNRIAAFTWFLQYGLAETLMSYGVDWAELEFIGHKPSERAIIDCVRAVPEKHRNFIHSLQPTFETANFFATHAFWDPDDSDDSRDMQAQLEKDSKARYRLLWERFTEEQIARKKKWKRPGYFGHTPVYNYRQAGGDLVPVFGEKLVLLDTAVALSATGFLSAACAESGTVLQANRAGEIVELESSLDMQV
jgi:serine/threonine protein phosphatase 1